MSEGGRNANILSVVWWALTAVYLAAAGAISDSSRAPYLIGLVAASLIPLLISGIFVVRWRVIAPAVVGAVVGVGILIFAIRMNIAGLFWVLPVIPAAATFLLQRRGPFVGGTAIVVLWTTGVMGLASAVVGYPSSSAIDIAMPAVIAGAISLVTATVGAGLAILVGPDEARSVDQPVDEE